MSNIPREYDDLIFTAAVQAGLTYDWRIYWAQIRQESNFDKMARSQAGALGLAQFMPKTWAEWAPKAGFPKADQTDPEASAMTGAVYMRHLWGRWTAPRPEIDRICLALASYNAGFSNILKAQRLSDNASDYKTIIKSLRDVTGDKNAHETITYVRRILDYYCESVTG